MPSERPMQTECSAGVAFFCRPPLAFAGLRLEWSEAGRGLFIASGDFRTDRPADTGIIFRLIADAFRAKVVLPKGHRLADECRQIRARLCLAEPALPQPLFDQTGDL